MTMTVLIVMKSTRGFCVLLDELFDVAKLECMHEFHLNCLTEWYNKPNTQYKCPCCYVPRNILTVRAAKKSKKIVYQYISCKHSMHKKKKTKKQKIKRRQGGGGNCIIS